MKILQERGFFGAGLVPVTTPLLVDRYNDCLKAIGKEPTERKRFAIDGAGWSPQIAAEREDLNYLCHGEANLYAILLTPEQRGKPVYLPMHSFDWKILETIHSGHRKAVHNLTGMSGIVLDIDQDIDTYYSPFDLLMLHGIQVKASTPSRIMNVASEQRELVARFRHEEDAYANQALLTSLIDSARQHGDLRHRSMHLPEVPFNEVANFYTRALGGVFVFRDSPKGGDPIVISETGRMEKDPAGRHDLFSLKEEPNAVLNALDRAGLATRFTRLPEKERDRWLDLVLESLKAQAIYASGYREDLSTVTAAQKKGAFLAAKGYVPEVYQELDELQREFQLDKGVTRPRLSAAAWKTTMIPNPKLDPLTSDIVWQVLCLANPVDLEMTFRHSKQQFYRLFQEWGPGQRQWAIHWLESKGLPHLERF